MAIRNIRVDDDPILRKKSREVTEFNDRLFDLLDDMKETMYHSGGVGLAGPQVGVLKRVVVMDVSEDRNDFIELINPEITFEDGAQTGVEGCLSLPGLQGTVTRPNIVKVKAQNREGKWCLYKGEALKARCFCHEIDHLDGVLYKDKLDEGECLYRVEAEED
ncbi:MAG: peptide deformylase [Clostridia bacterium]|nr:peptide deformylase [Clostridia bacterium]MBQ6837337.1 peptide deformylase [Clostridia bacterium]